MLAVHNDAITPTGDAGCDLGSVEIISTACDIDLATTDLERDLALTAAPDYRDTVLAWWHEDRSTPVSVENGAGRLDTWVWSESA